MRLGQGKGKGILKGKGKGKGILKFSQKLVCIMLQLAYIGLGLYLGNDGPLLGNFTLRRIRPINTVAQHPLEIASGPQSCNTTRKVRSASHPSNN